MTSFSLCLLCNFFHCLYWQPKSTKTDVNDKKIDVSNFNIYRELVKREKLKLKFLFVCFYYFQLYLYCSLHPSLAIQAQNDIAAKNCNFALTQVESSVVLDKIKSENHESKDSAVVEEDKNLANSMAAIKI